MSALDRALQVIDILSRHEDGEGLIRLSEELGVPAPSLHRLLGVLAKHNVVRQDARTRYYELGPVVLLWARSFLQHDSIAAVSQPVLDTLRSTIRESVFVTELIDKDAYVIATAESQGIIRFYMGLGQRMPYHAAASARAILAYQSVEIINELLHSERERGLSVSTDTSDERLAKILEQVRMNGYAVSESEIDVGVTTLSLPIRDMANRVRASISAVAPSPRLTGAPRRTALDALLDASDSISLALGAPARTSPREATVRPEAANVQP